MGRPGLDSRTLGTEIMGEPSTGRHRFQMLCGVNREPSDEDPVPRWANKILRDMVGGIPKVCRSCNNEWKSRIGTAAIPLVAPMIRGIRTGIRSETRW